MEQMHGQLGFRLTRLVKRGSRSWEVARKIEHSADRLRFYAAMLLTGGSQNMQTIVLQGDTIFYFCTNLPRGAPTPVVGLRGFIAQLK